MRWKVMLDFLRDIFSALSHAAGNSAGKEEPAPAPDVSTVDTVTGWDGDPPYRYVDVSRYQGSIDWAKVKAAGYKGAMLKTVSTNRKLSKRADGLYIDPTFETNYSWTWACTTTPTLPARPWPMQSLPLCGRRSTARS
jgi:GH25 family lysozyme M1 (1,4-beta-N-acetylmuramidase)